jgi:hypothetical protein
MKLVWLIKVCLHESSTKVRTCKHLSTTFLIHDGLNEEHALSPLIFNFALEYAITEV